MNRSRPADGNLNAPPRPENWSLELQYARTERGAKEPAGFKDGQPEEEGDKEKHPGRHCDWNDVWDSPAYGDCESISENEP